MPIAGATSSRWQTCAATTTTSNYVPYEIGASNGFSVVRARSTPSAARSGPGLVHAFPTLSITVTSLAANDDGYLVAEMLVSGTQAGTWGVANKGQAFEMLDLFVLHVGPDGLIDSVTTPWATRGSTGSSVTPRSTDTD